MGAADIPLPGSFRVSGQGAERLSAFQLDLASAFFALPESVGFLLAGGGALIAQGLVNRETDDLDFFADRAAGDVAIASDALIGAAGQRGWIVDVIRTGPEFRRLEITRPTSVPDQTEVVYVDLAVDSPPTAEPMITIAGPAFAPYELAIRKTGALFARAEPRDFTDVYALHQQFDRAEILHDAAGADAGFDLQVFVQMLRSHRRLRDEDFPETTAPIEELRAYFDAWADQLAQTTD